MNKKSFKIFIEKAAVGMARRMATVIQMVMALMVVMAMGETEVTEDNGK